MTTGPAEIFDLGYRGYEGERTSRWRAGGWRSGGTGCGSRSDSARGAGAKFASWLLIGLALVPIVVLVVFAAFLSPAEEAADDFELPSYPDYYDWAIVPLGLFAAVVAPLLHLPRPARRRALALRRTADHGDRLRRLALGGVRDRVRGRSLASGGGALHLERARRGEHGLLARGQLGCRPAVHRRRGDGRGTSHDAVAAHGVVRRRGAHTRPWRRSPCSSSAGGRRHRGGELRGLRSRTSSRSPTSPRSLSIRSTGSSATTSGRPRAGWVSALWLTGVTVVLAAWLVQRTRQLVRGMSAAAADDRPSTRCLAGSQASSP